MKKQDREHFRKKEQSHGGNEQGKVTITQRSRGRTGQNEVRGETGPDLVSVPEKQNVCWVQVV